MEAILLDQVEYPIPLIAEEKKETTYHQLWIRTNSGEKLHFYNLTDEELETFKQDYFNSDFNSHSFEHELNTGSYILNPKSIEYVKIYPQKRKMRNAWDRDAY